MILPREGPVTARVGAFKRAGIGHQGKGSWEESRCEKQGDCKSYYSAGSVEAHPAKRGFPQGTPNELWIV